MCESFRLVLSSNSPRSLATLLKPSSGIISSKAPFRAIKIEWLRPDARLAPSPVSIFSQFCFSDEGLFTFLRKHQVIVSRGDFFRICPFVFGFGFSFFFSFFRGCVLLKTGILVSMLHCSIPLSWSCINGCRCIGTFAITQKKASHLPRGLSTVFGVFATQLPEF